MGLAKEIEKVLSRQLACHVAWLPIANTLELGDYGIFANGVFSKLGNVQEFDVRVERRSSPASKVGFTSADARVAKFAGNVAVDVIPEGAIAAKVKVTFQRADSLLLKCAAIEAIEMQNVAEVMGKLARSDAWKRRYKVVSKVYQASKLVLLSSRSDDTEVVIEGDTPALRQFNLGEASAGLHISANHELGLNLTARAACSDWAWSKCASSTA